MPVEDDKQPGRSRRIDLRLQPIHHARASAKKLGIPPGIRVEADPHDIRIPLPAQNIVIHRRLVAAVQHGIADAHATDADGTVLMHERIPDAVETGGMLELLRAGVHPEPHPPWFPGKIRFSGKWLKGGNVNCGRRPVKRSGGIGKNRVGKKRPRIPSGQPDHQKSRFHFSSPAENRALRAIRREVEVV